MENHSVNICREIRIKPCWRSIGSCSSGKYCTLMGLRNHRSATFKGLFTFLQNNIASSKNNNGDICPHFPHVALLSMGIG